MPGCQAAGGEGRIFRPLQRESPERPNHGLAIAAAGVASRARVVQGARRTPARPG